MAKIIVIAGRCKSCGYCVKFCPQQILAIGTDVNEKGYEAACSVRPEKCTGCAVCARMCPEGAIDVYR